MTLFEDIFDSYMQNNDDYNPDWDTPIDDNPEPTYNDKEGNGFEIKPPYTFTTYDGHQENANLISNFHNDFAIVDWNNMENFINKEGKCISDEWFKTCDDFEDGWGLVRKRNGFSNYINSDGNYLFNNDVERATGFQNGQAMIYIGGKRHLINPQGEIIE